MRSSRSGTVLPGRLSRADGESGRAPTFFEEVIAHLAGQQGADVRLAREIEAFRILRREAGGLGPASRHSVEEQRSVGVLGATTRRPELVDRVEQELVAVGAVRQSASRRPTG